MKDYVAEFQSRLAEINADSSKVHIINAGIMNHGKSSLLNSLMDAEVFAVQDVRQTVENKTERWLDDVYLTDTPGLEAENVDDATAFAAYRRANLIIFVHNVNVGELHKNELDAINKIKALFNNDDFFWKHFCLVLTFKDSDSGGSNIEAIRNKTLDDIKANCGSKGFAVFVVSNTRYKKGRAENKSKLVELSGIPELKSYLQQNLQTWRSENSYFRNMRIASAKDELVAKLQQERGAVQSRINSKTAQIQQRQKNFMYKVEEAVRQRSADESKYNSERSSLNSMKSDLQNLRDRWNSERY